MAAPTIEALLARRKVTARSRAKVATVPAPQSPRAIVVDFTSVLLKLSREMDAIVFGAFEDAGLRFDAAEGGPPPMDDLERAVREIERRVGKVATRKSIAGELDRIANRTGKHSRAEFQRQLQRAIGIAPSSESLNLELFVASFRKRNLDLIKSLADDKVQRVKQVLVDSPNSRVETIAKRIREQTDVTASRAALIARDQVLKLNAEITQERHTQAGITEYEWSTSQDERVRDSHRALEGKRFEYAKPPIVDPKSGRRANPGEDYQCRCVALPVLPE